MLHDHPLATFTSAPIDCLPTQPQPCIVVRRTVIPNHTLTIGLHERLHQFDLTNLLGGFNEAKHPSFIEGSCCKMYSRDAFFKPLAAHHLRTHSPSFHTSAATSESLTFFRNSRTRIQSNLCEISTKLKCGKTNSDSNLESIEDHWAITDSL